MENRRIEVFFPGRPLRLTKQHRPGDKFFLFYSTGKPPLHLTLNEDRILCSKLGIKFACEDETMMVDLTDRPGVGFFSLSENHWSQRAAKVHDFETSCRAYQETHSRSEAEAHFTHLLEQLSNSMIQEVQGEGLSFISRMLSWFFWDVKRTRWK